MVVHMHDSRSLVTLTSISHVQRGSGSTNTMGWLTGLFIHVNSFRFFPYLVTRYLSTVSAIHDHLRTSLRCYPSPPVIDLWNSEAARVTAQLTWNGTKHHSVYDRSMTCAESLTGEESQGFVCSNDGPDNNRLLIDA